MRGRGAAVTVIALALLLGWGPLRDLDWGWHLPTFQRVVDEGRLPWDDQFSWGSRGPYEPVHLVFQLGAWSLHRLAGPAGLIAYRLGLVLAFAGALWLALRRHGVRPWVAAALCGAVLFGSEFRLTTRPHMFSFLFLVLLLDTLLAMRERGLRHPLRLLPLFAVWANAHPGVVYGVALAWGFLGVEAWRAGPGDRQQVLRWGGWVLAGTLATCLGPLGPGLYPYLLAHRDMQAQIDVAELRGLFEHPERGVGPHLRLAGLYVAALLLAARGRRSLDLTLGLAALCFMALGLVIARSGPLALVVLAFALGPALGRVRWPGFALALALAIPGVAALERHATQPRGILWPGRYAVRAADWIAEQRPQGRIYNTNYLGGYLVYRFAPLGLKVHTDGRTPMFLEALRESRDWPTFSARYQPAVVLLDWGPGPRWVHAPELDEAFREDYALVHVSAGAKLYLRRSAGNDALIERYAYRQLRYVGRLATRVPEDPALLAAEVERARREDPSLPFLPAGVGPTGS